MKSAICRNCLDIASVFSLATATLRALILASCGLAVVSDVLAEEPIVVRSPAGYFEFHIDPWISLHHFAYHLTRGEQRDLKLRGYVRISEADKRALTPDFRSACSSLAAAYRPHIVRSLLFDEETRAIAKDLWNGPDAVTDTAVRDALTECMPMYEATLWPSHRDAGKEFLAALLVQLDAHEAAMASALATALDSAWPDAPIRVDLTPYVIWAGAYTDDFPPNLTLSSVDEEIVAYAFEFVFHESAHTGDFSRSLEAAANAALESAGLENDRFWHYILFYATGRTVAEVLGDPDYVPYSRAVGLSERRSARPYYQALGKAWDKRDSFRERVLLAAELVAEERNQAVDDQRDGGP